jgi:hypothetical protein
MTEDKSPSELVTEEEKRQAFDAACRKLFTRLGLDPDLSQVKIRFGLHTELSREQQQMMAKAMGLQIALQAGRDQLLSEVRTKQDLDNALRAIDEAAEQSPTIARKVMDQIRAELPRRGGPGREPKLNPEESAKVCDEIARYVREGDRVKQAIAKTSAKCLELIGKAVGTRTLEKAWSKRGNSR